MTFINSGLIKGVIYGEGSAVAQARTIDTWSKVASGTKALQAKCDRHKNLFAIKMF